MNSLVWEGEHQGMFEVLMVSLLNSAALKFPYPSCPFIVTCDVSKVALGLALEQTGEQGRSTPVASSSQKLNERGTKYWATDLQRLAFVEALKTYWAYSLDTIFTVYTGHSALQWLLLNHKLEGCLWNWTHKVSEYPQDSQFIISRYKLGCLPAKVQRIWISWPTVCLFEVHLQMLFDVKLSLQMDWQQVTSVDLEMVKPPLVPLYCYYDIHVSTLLHNRKFLYASVWEYESSQIL